MHVRHVTIHPRTVSLCLLHGTADNELVFDFAPWLARLPRSVEAIFVQPGAAPTDHAKARAVHAAFCSAFNLTSETSPPLVKYDPKGSPDAPFSRVYPEPSCDRDALVNV